MRLQETLAAAQGEDKTIVADFSSANGRYLRFKYVGGGRVGTLLFLSTTGATQNVVGDVVSDTPANNFCTLNPLASWNSTLTNGNLDWYSTTTYGQTQSTIAVSSGKWYYEATIVTASMLLGIKSVTAPVPGELWEGNRAYYSTDGRKFEDGTATTYGASYTDGDIIGVALDMDAGTLTFYKNGVSQGIAFSGITEPQTLGYVGSNGNPASASFNFGQRPFIYTPPANHLALATTNLPEPAIADGSTAMNAATYTGNNAVNPIALDFSADFMWLKCRDTDETSHALFDTIRGG